MGELRTLLCIRRARGNQEGERKNLSRRMSIIIKTGRGGSSRESWSKRSGIFEDRRLKRKAAGIPLH